LRRKRKITITNERERQHERELDIRDGGANRERAIGDEIDVDRARDRLFELRHHRLDPVDDVERVGRRRLEDQQNLGQIGPEPGARAGVLRPVDYGGDVPQLDRRAAAVGDDHLAELVGAGQLLVDVERKLRVVAFEIARRLENAL
jgi:hypothetical protein